MKASTFVCADEPAIEHELTDAVAIGGLCRKPEQLADYSDHFDGAVLVLHESTYELAQVQKALRSVEVDPLGVQILEVPEGATEIGRSVRGLIARGAAFAGSSPENAKPVLPRTVTRRGLLRPPTPEYLAAPMINHDVCGAADGCRACVDVCPQEAYEWRKGGIVYNKEVCEPCGRCVTTCPTGAISNPAATPAMLKAQIAALVDGDDTAVRIRFVCARRLDRTWLSGWHNVEVPCTGMVPGVWLVATLLMGASSVALVSCSASGCSIGLDTQSNEAVDFAQTALRAAGLDPDLAASRPGKVATPRVRRELDNPFAVGGSVEVMLALADMAGESIAFEHDGSHLGIALIEPDACTLCTQCSQTCPTGALLHGYEEDAVKLTFDAALCTNCRQCTLGCPEIDHGAIAVEAGVDTTLLTAGRGTLNEGIILSCERCGKPIAPSKMMDRIGTLLGDEFAGTMDHLTRRCVDCRGL